jgi:hypothetical protein
MDPNLIPDEDEMIEHVKAEFPDVLDSAWAAAEESLLSDGEDPTDAEIEELAHIYVEDLLSNAYSKVKRFLRQLRPGASCYRAIALRHGTDPAAIRKLGVHWSMRIGGALPYLSDPDLSVRATFEALLDPPHVDIFATVAHNMAYGVEEDEVVFFTDSPIYVESVWITARDETPHLNVDEPIRVEAWYRT